MADVTPPAVIPPSFIQALDKQKRRTRGGIEYWRARELQMLLGYDTWENFTKVMARGQAACVTAGLDPNDHFLETTKMIETGKGAQRAVPDWFLSRYACYLVAMNGDPSKPQIGYAQTYFAVQTRRQEIADQEADEDKRIELRRRVTNGNKALASAAKGAGVRRYAVFQDAGYRGLYGELGLQQIKARKRLAPSADLLDRAGREELAANDFRITQTEAKLVRECIQGENRATQTHHAVGQRVRAAIREMQGTMPEDLPTEPSIKKIEKHRAKKMLTAK